MGLDSCPLGYSLFLWPRVPVAVETQGPQFRFLEGGVRVERQWGDGDAWGKALSRCHVPHVPGWWVGGCVSLWPDLRKVGQIIRMFQAWRYRFEF